MAVTVSFGDNPGTDVTVVSDTELTVTSPPGMGVAALTVTTAGGTATKPNAFFYDFGDPPTVDTIDPTEVTVGEPVTITLTGNALDKLTTDGSDFVVAVQRTPDDQPLSEVEYVTTGLTINSPTEAVITGVVYDTAGSYGVVTYRPFAPYAVGSSAPSAITASDAPAGPTLGTISPTSIASSGAGFSTVFTVTGTGLDALAYDNTAPYDPPTDGTPFFGWRNPTDSTIGVGSTTAVSDTELSATAYIFPAENQVFDAVIATFDGTTYTVVASLDGALTVGTP